MPRVQPISGLQNFHKIISSQKLSVIDFWATWCGPCKMISPVFEKQSDDPAYSEVDFYNVDVDAEPEIAQEVAIRAMPTFMFFHNGNKLESFPGADPTKLVAKLNENLAKVQGQ